MPSLVGTVGKEGRSCWVRPPDGPQPVDTDSFCLISCSKRLWLVRFSRARRTITPRVSPDSSLAHVLVSPPLFNPLSLPAPCRLLQAFPDFLLPILVTGNEEISPRVLQALGSEPIQVRTHPSRLEQPSRCSAHRPEPWARKSSLELLSPRALLLTLLCVSSTLYQW